MPPIVPPPVVPSRKYFQLNKAGWVGIGILAFSLFAGAAIATRIVNTNARMAWLHGHDGVYVRESYQPQYADNSHTYRAIVVKGDYVESWWGTEGMPRPDFGPIKWYKSEISATKKDAAGVLRFTSKPAIEDEDSTSYFTLSFNGDATISLHSRKPDYHFNDSGVMGGFDGTSTLFKIPELPKTFLNYLNMGGVADSSDLNTTSNAKSPWEVKLHPPLSNEELAKFPKP